MVHEIRSRILPRTVSVVVTKPLQYAWTAHLYCSAWVASTQTPTVKLASAFGSDADTGREHGGHVAQFVSCWVVRIVDI